MKMSNKTRPISPNSYLNVLNSLIELSSTTMDRYHAMIGSCITWAITLCGLFLVIGWNSDTSRILFLIGIIPVLLSYFVLLRYDRLYHRLESIRNRNLNSVLTIIDGNENSEDIISSIQYFNSAPLPSWRNSFNHMTFNAHGIIHGTLIVVLLTSFILRSVNINGGDIDGVTLGMNSAITNAQIDNVNVNGNSITATDTNGGLIIGADGLGTLTLNGAGISGAVILDEDDFASNSNTHLATQQSIKAYVDSVSLSGFVIRETPSGAVDGTNRSFTLANIPDAGTESVYLNGTLQSAGGEDYHISGPTITFVDAPLTNDLIRVTYFK